MLDILYVMWTIRAWVRGVTGRFTTPVIVLLDRMLCKLYDQAVRPSPFLHLSSCTAELIDQADVHSDGP